jgi:5-methylcytosine-specific restriction endonuclease McrA
MAANKTRYDLHREEYLAVNKIWRKENRDKVMAYRERNKSKRNAHLKLKRLKDKQAVSQKDLARIQRRKALVSEQGRRYYLRHKDGVLERSARNYAKNPADRCRQTNEWARNNPDKTRRYRNQRRAIVLGSPKTEPELIEKWEAKWKGRKSVRCYWCGGGFSPSKCHADHVIPLSRGGAHEIGNMAVSCAKCNQRKSSKTLNEWNLKIAQPVLL